MFTKLALRQHFHVQSAHHTDSLLTILQIYACALIASASSHFHDSRHLASLCLSGVQRFSLGFLFSGQPELAELATAPQRAALVPVRASLALQQESIRVV
jgi:hypothetical protein